MTHRDRAGDPSGHRAGRREAAGDAGHRQGFPTPSVGSPARPERRRPKAFGRRPAWLAMPRIAAPRAPGRKPWETVSMGHYQRSLVFGSRSERDKPLGQYQGRLVLAAALCGRPHVPLLQFCSQRLLIHAQAAREYALRASWYMPVW